MENYVLAIVGNKGGIGKTTLAYNFLYWLTQQDISAILIDCDNDQYSSADFALERKEAGIKPELVVKNMPTKDLRKNIVKLGKKYEVIIIEFGKANEDIEEVDRNSALELAIKLADKVVMPIQPSPVDVKTIEKVEAKLPLKARDVETVLVPNRIKSKDQLNALLRIQPDLEYFEFSKSFIKDRVCYQDSLGDEGRSVLEIKAKSKSEKEAKKEFRQLCKEIFYG